MPSYIALKLKNRMREYVRPQIQSHVHIKSVRIITDFLKIVGFLHLLPEIAEEMDTAFDELFHEEQDYPFAYFVVCVGFLIVLIIEQVVLSCVRNEPMVDHDATGPSCHCENIIRSGLPGTNGGKVYVLLDNYM